MTNTEQNAHLLGGIDYSLAVLKPEIQNDGVIRAMLPLKAPKEGASCLLQLPVFTCILRLVVTLPCLCFCLPISFPSSPVLPSSPLCPTTSSLLCPQWHVSCANHESSSSSVSYSTCVTGFKGHLVKPHDLTLRLYLMTPAETLT